MPLESVLYDNIMCMFSCALLGLHSYRQVDHVDYINKSMRWTFRLAAMPISLNRRGLRLVATPQSLSFEMSRVGSPNGAQDAKIRFLCARFRPPNSSKLCSTDVQFFETACRTCFVVSRRDNMNNNITNIGDNYRNVSCMYLNMRSYARSSYYVATISPRVNHYIASIVKTFHYIKTLTVTNKNTNNLRV